ncbi:aminopeptidase P family protein [Olivibacter sp. SDN3]|uniref:aminopeptidase P family protein n=1 Tax=Olivibacter sp. SDN3 TaxID=2764720 RepID=UPI0016512D05|nr:aminopeptidase P family protein [Olivibacter sp. SDN3]QNL48712.1 aminopeptidase P family protein [Olivibacter sp. SDN3]
MTYTEKLLGLRKKMKEQQIDAYIIPSSDPHISEYLPDRFKCIAFASGFTGSAGTLVITEDFAGLWTDARYFVQANEQLKDSGFQLVKLKNQGKPEYIEWLSDSLTAGNKVAFDGKLASVSIAKHLIAELQPSKILIDGTVDLLDEIWTDRPGLPNNEAYLLDEKTVGAAISEKIAKVRDIMLKAGAKYHLISSLDDIAWLFNIRGNDVKCNPVVLSFALLSDKEVTLFIDQEKLQPHDQEKLKKAGVHIAAYDQLVDSLAKLPVGGSVLIDPKRTCYAVYTQIPQYENTIEGLNPTTRLKAIKNTTEAEHIRQTMVKDGVALTRFFKWLEENISQTTLTELSITDKLLQFRQQQEGFVNESFDTIAGYLAHGALPHYKATDQSNATLASKGLLLIDSGGQYRTGTTDITRVISLGELTDAERVDYTLVLKGMIEGSTTTYPKGSRGYQIDAITRKPLWDRLRNYGHGTGHGVGFFLNVHEGPHVFNTANIDIEIEEGMVTSIEPGLYREGRYGIRIENLVLSIADQETDFGEFMAFETLTLCYIDTQLVDKTLLDQKHIDWLNSYNNMVYERISPLLEVEEQQWLAEKTAII